MVLWLSLLFIWSLAPLAGFDFWFYLAVGRDIVQSGEIPWTQSYLGTTSVLGVGAYANLAWLGNLICYLAFAAAGPLGLVLLKSGLLAATTGTVYAGCRLSGLAPFWAGAWSTLGLWTIRGRFEMRTYLFTDLALAALVLLLIMVEREPRPRRDRLAMFWLFVLWTNLHQGIIAGFLVGACWTLLGRAPWKYRLQLAGLAAAGSMVKPHALDFPAFIYDHFANQSAIGGVVEWAAPTRAVLVDQLGLFYAVLLLVAVSFLWQIRRRQPPPWAFGALVLFFAVLALRSVRAVTELLPVVCPLAAAYFPNLTSSRRLQTGIALVLCVALWWVFPVGARGPLGQVTGYPDHLVEALPKDGSQVFNSFEFGNYLVFKQIPPFLHGMTPLYEEQVITDFEDVLNPTPQREEILRKFKVGSALLHFPTDNDATLNLVDTLADSPDWKLQLWDDSGLLFVRGPREEGLTAVQPWRSPAWTNQAAARKELESLVQIRPGALAHRLLSQLCLERGDLAQATHQAAEATRLAPNYSGAWSQLGTCYAKAGNLEGMLDATRRAVETGANDAPARFNLALGFWERSRRSSEPLATLDRWRAGYQARRALTLDPGFEPARKLLQQL